MNLYFSEYVGSIKTKLKIKKTFLFNFFLLFEENEFFCNNILFVPSTYPILNIFVT